MIEQQTTYQGNPVRLVWRPSSLQQKFSPAAQSAACCFDTQGNLLIVKQKRWGIPGGTLEQGETSEQTLHREVDEEASVSLDVVYLLGAVEVFFPNNPNKNQGEHFFQLRYAAMIREFKPLRPDPCTGVIPERKLISPAEFGTYVLWGSMGEVMRDEAVKWYTSQVHHK